MGIFLVRRTALAVVALFGVLVLSYVLIHVAPVDPVRMYAGPRASEATQEQVRKELGLNRSVPVQIAVYIKNFFTGNWGVSIQTKQPVRQDIGKTLPYTLELVLCAMVLVCLIGIPMGVASAHKKDQMADHVSRIVAVGLVSIPTFWLALALQYVFSGKLHLLPLSGTGSYQVLLGSPIRNVTGFPLIDALITGNFSAFWDHLQHLILPVLALTGMALGLMQRLTRASMLEILNEDYILAARSYGLLERRVLWQRAMKNSRGPIATIIALDIAYLLVNTFLIESIFAWPGIGNYIVSAVSGLDYPAIMAVTLVSAVTYLILNTVADIVIASDPRIRIRG